MPFKRIISVIAAAILFCSAGAAVYAGAARGTASPSVKNELSGSQLSEFIVMAPDGTKSHNIGGHSYNWSSYPQNSWNWADNAKSYLTAGADGTFTRVEYIGKKLVVEKYSSDFRPGAVSSIQPELPLFGGFFSGAKYHFVVWGQENPDYSDEVEVVRVVKYDKSWKRLGSASFFGKNTYIPFEAGAVSMDEADGKLFIHTSHKMYADANNVNHQANLTFFVDEESMESLYENYRVWNISSGYVSHSFNQVVRSDGEYVYTADHGDAYPRSIVLVKRSLSGSAITNKDILAIQGSTGANVTKATLGDMRLSDGNVLTVGTSVRQDDSYDDRSQKNVFVAAAAKSDLTLQSFLWLTGYEESDSVTVCNPYLVKTAADRFVVLWEEYAGSDNFLKCAVIDGSGNLVSSLSLSEDTDEGLSDCAPIVSGGRIIWYTTGSRSDNWWSLQDAAPNFYRLPAGMNFTTITRHPADVTVKSGENATFTVEATGSGLRYQWYYKKAGQTSWNVWKGRTTPSTTAAANDSWDGMQVRCAVTDADGRTVYSDPATITVNTSLVITEHPRNVSAASGENVTFTVKATGVGLKYQWYYKKAGQSDWNKWGSRTTASTTATSNDGWNGMQVRCAVTDSKGVTVYSNPATVTITFEFRITSQPQSKTIALGESLTLSVKASGNGLKYQWYYRKKDQTSWSVWKGRTHASETVTPNATWDGIRLYCLVMDASGNTLKSSVITVTFSSEFKIITQPQGVLVRSGDNVTFTVKASGTGLKYQWYYKKAGCNTSWALWKNHTTATTVAPANDTWEGMAVYCKVTDGSGKMINSNAAYVHLINEKIMSIRSGSTITIRNTADGEGFTYQWYYKKKGDADWRIWKGHTSPELSVTSNDTWDGMEIHCRITDSTGSDINRTVYKIELS